MVYRETYRGRDNYCLQLLRLRELPNVSRHLLIFLKLLEQQISRRARKRETKLVMNSGIRKRLWLLTKGNWNQKQSKTSFRGGEQESNVEHWQGELGQQERITLRICWSCFWTEVIRKGRFVQASTNFQSLESLPPFHHRFCAAACETFWHSI